LASAAALPQLTNGTFIGKCTLLRRCFIQYPVVFVVHAGVEILQQIKTINIT
jgi:hypothetical protein